MNKVENYEQQYAEYYKAEYESVRSRFEEYQKTNIHHTPDKVGRDFRTMIYKEKTKLISKEEPIDGDGTLLRVLHNAYKDEVLNAFKKREANYRITPVATFMDEGLPAIREKHIEKLRSGNCPLDYQWDVEFIENHTINDLLQMLAKYFALHRFIDEVDSLAVELDKKLEDEKRLVSENKFNGLKPSLVFGFFRHLTQINKINGIEFLSKEKVIELTNNICTGNSTKPITLNIDKNQQRDIIGFFMLFIGIVMIAHLKKWSH